MQPTVQAIHGFVHSFYAGWEVIRGVGIGWLTGSEVPFMGPGPKAGKLTMCLLSPEMCPSQSRNVPFSVPKCALLSPEMCPSPSRNVPFSVPKCALLSPSDAILRLQFAILNPLRALLESETDLLHGMAAKYNI